MEKKVFKLLILLTAILLDIILLNCRPGEIPYHEIESQELLNLSKLNPKINEVTIGSYSCAFAVDENENLYFADSQKHRVLKFDIKGQFQTQIGHIGMEGEGLYYPYGLYIKNSKIYILDNRGRSLKIYDINGNFVSWQKFDNAYWSEALCVENGNIFVNIRYLDEESYNDKSLISVFSEEGECVTNFGKIIQSHKFFGYAIFNTCFLTLVKGRIYGAFRYNPTVFCYDIKGKEVYYQDFKNKKLEEIESLNKESIRKGMDVPEIIKTADWGVRSMIYCTGFTVDQEGIGYMAFDYENGNRNIIICLDRTGKPIKKLKLQLLGKPVRNIAQIYITSSNKRFALGYVKGSKDFYLFRF